jgi:hypothetical protein
MAGRVRHGSGQGIAVRDLCESFNKVTGGQIISRLFGNDGRQRWLAERMGNFTGLPQASKTLAF